ncbi:Protein Shroom1, partial [Lamprotornis superbus]
KTTSVQHPNKDSRSSPKEIPSRSYTASAQCLEIQREGHQLQRSSHHHQHSADDLLLQNKDLIFRSPVGALGALNLGLRQSPASFTEESFQNDYIEKLKVAQKKVLKETSFKRKDLQMSLPLRLRQKSSKWPSAEHLWSFLLYSASKDAKPVPCSPSHLESLESFNRKEEIQRPQKAQHVMDKEVSWSQVRDEITEQDAVASRRRVLENRGRAFSSSSISRTELKQIQHSALIKYIERKISQRPSGSQHLPLHKPPLQKRLSNPKGPPGQIYNPNGNEKRQNDEVLCQLLSEQKSPGVFPSLPFAPPLKVTGRTLADVPEVQQHRASAVGAVPAPAGSFVVHMGIFTRKSHGDGPKECPKSEQETKKRSKDPASMGNQVLKRNRDSTNELELMASLQSRLQVLWEEQKLVLLEVRECAKWGEELEVMVQDLCKPNEFDCYTMFIGDLEKVNAMSRMDGNTEAEEKREDAKDLKENLDRRERVVSGILAKYLTEQQLQDYQHFVQGVVPWGDCNPFHNWHL